MRAQSHSVQDPAVAQLNALYSALDAGSPASIDAFLAEVRRLREGRLADPAYVALIHARGLYDLQRDEASESVLRAAVDETSSESEPRAFLLLELADRCSGRREAASVLELAARAEAMCARVDGLAQDPEFQFSLLKLRCQAWLDLGRLERMAAVADELARLAPRLAPEQREEAALQRCNALLASFAWQGAEALAREQLAELELPPDLRAQWRLRLAAALTSMSRLEPRYGAEAHVEFEGALASDALEPHEHDTVLLADAELATRERAFERAVARLDQFAARHADAPSSDVEHRALYESLRIEAAFELRSERAELALRRDEARAAIEVVHANWRARPSVSGGQSFLLFPHARFLLGQLARLEIALDGERAGVERAIETFARLQTAGTAARTLELPVIDAERLRSDVLGGQATLLVVLPNSLRTHVLVLTPDGAFAAEGAAREKLELLRGALASRLLTRPAAAGAARTESLRKAAADLRDELLDGKVIAELQARPAVVVVGDDLLGGIYLEALDLGGGRAFGVERGVAHAPSLPLAVALAGRSRGPEAAGPWDVVVLGAPEYAQDVRERWPRLEPMPLGVEDLRQLGAGFADERVHVISGPDATLSALHDPRVAPALLMQIVTHGVYDIELDDPAGLVLARGSDGQSVAWRSNLRGLAVPRIVALWACGTQRGPSRLGDDTASHLGSALLEAHACTVIVSPADVALKPSLRIGRRFSRELARGTSAVEALRAARAEVAADEETADPFFHASVVLYGDPGFGGRDRLRAVGAVEDSSARSSSGKAAAAILACAILAAAALAGWFVRRGRARRS